MRHRNALSIALMFMSLSLGAISGCGGKNLGQLLDDQEAKLNSTIGQIGGTAGLTELQLLETLKMQIQELRAQWKDILGENLDTLNLEQKKMLDNLSQATGKIDALIDRGVTFEDLAVLDLNVTLEKLGFSRTNEIRRIAPAAQGYRTSGTSTYMITLPLFGTGNKIQSVSMGDKDVTQFLQELPPHAIRLDIPASNQPDKGIDMSSFFDDWKLQRSELKITLKKPTKWWKFWTAKTETISVHTGFFPRFPLRYWFAEHPIHTEIDQDPAHQQVVNAPPTIVAGCGNSGCYWNYVVCASAPINSEPIGDIFNKQDSFIGWGDFIGPPRISANLVCMTYQQHSHNQNRTSMFTASEAAKIGPPANCLPES